MSVAAMTLANNYYECLMDNMTDAVLFVDGEGNVVSWNRAAERLTGLRGEQIIGKPCRSDRLIHIDDDRETESCGEHPAWRVLTEGRELELNVYLRHAQGHLLPVRARVLPIHDTCGEVIGVLEVFGDNSAAVADEMKAEELRDKSLLDPLTDLASRRHLEIRLEARLEEMKRYGWRFGVVTATIDNFLAIQEAHGQEIADQLIRMVGKTFANTMRSYDVVGRWEVDEFLSITPIKGQSDLAVVGDRVRVLVEKAQLTTESMLLGVTVSVGVAGAEAEDCVELVVDRAHLCMYESMETGGNTVTE